MGLWRFPLQYCEEATIGIVLHILFMSQINKNLLVGLGSGSISGMVIDSVI